MRVISFHGKEEPLPISQEQWGDLIAANETNTPFQTWEWFLSWWHVFGDRETPLLVIGYREDRPVALAPLMIVNRNGRKATVTFSSDGKSDYCDVLCRTDKTMFIDLLLQHLRERTYQWNIVRLRNIPESSSTVLALSNWSERHGLRYLQDGSACPCLDFGRHPDLDRISLPKSLRRHLSYLKRSGGLSFRVLRTEAEALGLLDVFFQQHIERWQANAHRSLFVEQVNRDFYRELVRRAIDSGWLFFSCLEYQEQPIAFHFGFDYNNHVFWYKPSFSIAFKNRSPGRILIKYLIDYCVVHEKSTLDFTIGQEAFKSYYANSQTAIVDFTLFFRRRDYWREVATRSTRAKVKKMIIGPLQSLKGNA